MSELWDANDKTNDLEDNKNLARYRQSFQLVRSLLLCFLSLGAGCQLYVLWALYFQATLVIVGNKYIDVQ